MSYLNCVKKNLPQSNHDNNTSNETSQENTTKETLDISLDTTLNQEQANKTSESENSSNNDTLKKKSKNVKFTNVKFTKRENSKNKKPLNPNFIKARELAEKMLLGEFKLSGDNFDNIVTELEYIKDYKYLFKLDVSNDTIVTTVESKEYKFSKRKFLSNKYFRDQLGNYYSNLFNMKIWVSLFESKKDKNQYFAKLTRGY